MIDAPSVFDCDYSFTLLRAQTSHWSFSTANSPRGDRATAEESGYRSNDPEGPPTPIGERGWQREGYDG